MQFGKVDKPGMYCFDRKPEKSSSRSTETLIIETEKTGESSTPVNSTRSSTRIAENLPASKKQKTIPTEPASQHPLTQIEQAKPDAVLVTMNGIAGTIYPFLENKQTLVEYLTQLSICWTDPITYGKSSEPFDTKFALRSWYRTSHKWDPAENWS